MSIKIDFFFFPKTLGKKHVVYSGNPHPGVVLQSLHGQGVSSL